MAFLKRLAKRVSIVPVVCKADTMTTDELVRFRKEVTVALQEAGIQTAHPPVAVICADKEQEPASKAKRGREYPWGVALSEDDNHSQLPTLRKFLLTEGLLALKQASVQNYEHYRVRTLRRRRVVNGVALVVGVIALDARRRAWVLACAARWMQGVSSLTSLPSWRVRKPDASPVSPRRKFSLLRSPKVA